MHTTRTLAVGGKTTRRTAAIARHNQRTHNASATTHSRPTILWHTHGITPFPPLPRC